MGTPIKRNAVIKSAKANFNNNFKLLEKKNNNL